MDAKEKSIQFLKWFKAQFGVLPSELKGKQYSLNKKVQASKAELESLQAELTHVKSLSAIYDAALKTRYASEKDFKF